MNKAMHNAVDSALNAWFADAFKILCEGYARTAGGDAARRFLEQLAGLEKTYAELKALIEQD